MKLGKAIAILSITCYCNMSLSAQNLENVRLESTSPYVYDIDTALTDSLATPSAKLLYKYMLSQYGKRIISGQTDGYFENVITLTGKTPLVYNTDFQHYTQGYSYQWTGIQPNPFTFGWDDNGNTERAIAWYKSTNRKGIVSFQWHWHSPSGGTAGQNTFNKSSTSFNPSNAVIANTAENKAAIRDIDSIATQIRKMDKEDVPFLFRPLHEASGSGADNGSGAWFWWGGKGNVVMKKLYMMIHERLVNYHGLHNIIWVTGTPEASWYPGRNVVDIMGGVDSYAGYGNYRTIQRWFNVIYNTSAGKKMLAMPENGPIPDPNVCIDSAITWSYFATWHDNYITSNSAQHIKAVYNNPRVVTLENRDDDVSTLPGVTTSLFRKNDPASVLVYPNPTHDKLFIADIAKANSVYKLEVYSLQGSKLLEKRSYRDYISLEGLSEGVYILNLYLPSGIIRQKVTKW